MSFSNFVQPRRRPAHPASVAEGDAPPPVVPNYMAPFENDPTATPYVESAPPPYLDADPTASPHLGQLAPRPVDPLEEMGKYVPPPSYQIDRPADGEDEGGVLNFHIPEPQAPEPTPSAAVEIGPLDRKQMEHDRLAADSNPKDTNGRWTSMLLNAFYQMSRNAQAVSNGAARSGRPVDMYGVANIIGGGIGGAVAGGVRPEIDERRKREQRMGELETMIGTELARQKAQQEALLRAAQVEHTKAQTAYTLARPGIEGRKATVTERKRAQDLVLREIGTRLKDPRPFDPSDDYDGDLAERAAAAGVNFAPGSFGDYKNPSTFEVIDPTDPSGTRKTRMRYERSTGRLSPMAADGVPVVTGRVEARDARGVPVSKVEQMENTEAYRRATLGLSSERLEEQMKNGLSSRAARDFGTKTRGLFERRRQIEKDIADYQKRAASLTVDPAEAERRVGELRGELDNVTRGIEAARTEAVGTAEAPIDRRPSRAPASRPGRFSGRRMPRSNLPAAAKALGYGEGPAAEKKAEATITAEGGVVY